MNRTIWKTVLSPSGVQNIEVPVGAEMLCAREQFDQVCIWYLCDPNAPKETRKVAIVLTGGPAPADGRYIGTASLHGGSYIVHIFVWPQ